ncbi:MAG: TIGR04283 family arsenosugar biosynthesis glycosyltransferase [Planctomycetales bacterium]|nr:TIGR04283 family arsenosugar biosynthesis glycosyltransferase [Planctomycetales bacterium]
MVRCSVIIPTLNEAVNIVRAVNSARESGADEVIVADGGSGDETCRLAEQSGAMIVSAPRGRAVQQNAGAKAASGDVLLFLHADNWLGKDAIPQIRASLGRFRSRSERTTGCGAFQQKIEAAPFIYRLLERGNAERVRWLGLPYGDQAIFVTRELFDQVGGFPEEPFLEDVLLMQRLRRHSWPQLLPGPVHVSPRRWEKRGVIRQTLRNWAILTAFSLGASPQQLANWYR